MVWRPRSGTLAERILNLLQHYPEGATDTDLEKALKASHQHVNQVCRGLENRGRLARRQVGPTKRSFLIASTITSTNLPQALPPKTVCISQQPGIGLQPERPWYWEGNVQAVAAESLGQLGWQIRRVANTAAHEAGKDIEAERDGVRLWVTVKGFPEATSRTNPNTQARHWFSHAIFDVVLWRHEDPTVCIVIALPKRITYLNLAARTAWFQEAAQCSFLWVTEEGVEMEEGTRGVVQG